MTSNKNILILSPTPSHPQDAGNRKRIFALTKYLQELGATIYFVYCPREWDREIPKDAYDGMNQCWDYFFVAYPVQPAVHKTDDEYFELDAWWDVGIEFAVNWIKLSVEFDMVLCNYVFYSKVLELFDDSVTKVIDTHDIVSNRNYLLDRKLGYRDFFYVSPESEQKALNRAHLVLSIKEDEASWFKCLSNTHVLTIGHLEPEPKEILTRNIDYDNIKLGFIGSANPINVRNLESFLSEYLGLAEKYKNQCTFIIGGKVCDALDTRFYNQVQIIGKVNDVSEFYDLVDIVVLPFEFSTGLKIKTVEALSWSKPCIGTMNAFEGLGTNCEDHKYQTIKELAIGVIQILGDPEANLSRLRQDSKIVYENYTNEVKRAIEKLYKVNWIAIKKLQQESKLHIPDEINIKETTSKQTFQFNIITNVDFWNAQDNQELWLNFWIDSVRQIGLVNIYRTKSFKNISADKLELYKLDLVDNVHHRELYQIVQILQADCEKDKNKISVNILDFSSIIFDQFCWKEIENLHLANHKILFYFLNIFNIKSNKLITENAKKLLTKDFKNHNIFNLWDYYIDNYFDVNYQNYEHNILLPDHLISLNKTSHNLMNLDNIVVGISYTDLKNKLNLNKFILFYRDFLPQHFKLVIFSNLELTVDSSITLCPLKNAIKMIYDLDIFVCIEKAESISFLLYLCESLQIPIFAKYTENIQNKHIQDIENFTFLPQQYQLFIEKAIWQQKDNIKGKKYVSWQSFFEYWVNRVNNCIGKTNNEQTLVLDKK